jgi:hypothetical protein
MLSQAEKERIEQLENEVTNLRNEFAMQRIVVSGLLHSLLRSDSVHQSTFFTALREGLNKLPKGSTTQQDYTYEIQKWIELYR